jgi:hypothetical protein
MTDFIKHTNGALALLALRGESQLQRQEGLQLFFALRNEVVRITRIASLFSCYLTPSAQMISCILKRYPYPPQLIALSEKAVGLPGATISTKIGYQLTCIMAEVCDLRICHENNLKTIKPDLLSRSFALDSRVEALESTFPPDSMYETVAAMPGQSFQVRDSRRILPLDQWYHIYPNWILPNMWNNYRYCRILLNEIILNQLELMTNHPDAEPPTQDFKNICYRSCNLTRKLAHDVCASVPYMLGLIDDHKGQTKSAAGKMTILFPLYIAANVDGPGSAMCVWAQDCLTKLGRGMGIDQALILADLLSHENSMTGFVDAMHGLDDSPGDAEGQFNVPNNVVNQFYVPGA